MKGFFLLAVAVITACAEKTDRRRSLRPFKFPPDPQECGNNEEWLECVSGSCAETSCKRPTIGPICTADCRYGCYCTEGFYRNAQGSCVTLDQCPPEEGRRLIRTVPRPWSKSVTIRSWLKRRPGWSLLMSHGRLPWSRKASRPWPPCPSSCDSLVLRKSSSLAMHVIGHGERALWE
ncbi:ixochymostatin-like isoform X2 [Haemaphysalis longicornis]